MNKCHSPITWVNNTVPAINDTHLNQYDGELDTLDDRVITLDGTKLEASDVSTVIKNVAFSDSTGIFTFTRYNDSTFTVDTKLEKVVTNWNYDPTTQSLVLTLADGSTVSVPLSSFIQENDFVDSSTIGFTVTNHVVTATVLANSIGDAQMQTGYLTNCQNAKNSAEAAATTSGSNKLDSEAWARGTRNGSDVTQYDPTYHNNSKYYSDQASIYASDAEDAKDDAADILTEIQQTVSGGTFTVNFTTGELEYTNVTAYTFAINTTTGNLEWEVVA